MFICINNETLMAFTHGESSYLISLVTLFSSSDKEFCVAFLRSTISSNFQFSLVNGTLFQIVLQFIFLFPQRLRSPKGNEGDFKSCLQGSCIQLRRGISNSFSSCTEMSRFMPQNKLPVHFLEVFSAAYAAWLPMIGPTHRPSSL